MDKSTFYQIRIKGHLDDTLAIWFDGLTISNQENGEALLSGPIQDQAALHGVLNQISNLGLTLISVNAVDDEDRKNKQKEMIMKTIRLFVTHHPLVTFFALAYAFAWAPGLLHLTMPNFPYIQLTLGPFLAAVTVSALVGGRAEVNAYLRGLLHWRASVYWYILAIILPVLALVAVYINVLFGAAQPSTAQLAGITVFFPVFAYMLLHPLQPGVEELGWRGYAQPRLQVGRSALTASIILGIMHGLWHLPLFFVPGSAQASVPFAAFLLTTIALNVLMAWLYNSTQGSVLIAMICHASFDAIGLGFLDFLFSGTDEVRLWWLLAAVLSLAAGLVVLVMGPNLGLTRSTGEAERATVIR